MFDRLIAMFDWLSMSALLIAIVAIWGVIVTRRTARQQSTLGFITRYNNDNNVSLGHIALHKAEAKSPSDIMNGENRENILFLLIELEVLAIGLKHKIYDEKMIENFFGSELCHIHNDARHIIDHIREEDESSVKGDIAFEEFEKFAMKLSKKFGHAKYDS